MHFVDMVRDDVATNAGGGLWRVLPLLLCWSYTCDALGGWLACLGVLLKLQVGKRIL